MRKKHFAVGNRTFIQRKKDAMKRKDKALARKLIQPENCDCILDEFPKENEILHAITCGDFVMGDLIIRAIQRLGPPERLTLATLSMSLKNAEALADQMAQHPSLQVDLLLSHYFQNTNGDIFTAIENLLSKKFPERFSVKIERSHAKITLFEYPDAAYVIETSANLRSSNNIEQMVITNDRALLNFHRQWIEEVTHD